MKGSTSSVKSRVTSELLALSGKTRSELAARWREIYGIAAPPKMTRQFLYQGIARQLQEQVAGGLKSATQRFLEQAVKKTTAGETILAPIIAKPGTRLLREWHGVTYEVTLLDDGVLFQGKQYQSLSVVARMITGTRWSGPVFFGLKKKSCSKGDRE